MYYNVRLYKQSQQAANHLYFHYAYYHAVLAKEAHRHIIAIWMVQSIARCNILHPIPLGSVPQAS